MNTKEHIIGMAWVIVVTSAVIAVGYSLFLLARYWDEVGQQRYLECVERNPNQNDWCYLRYKAGAVR